MTDRDYTCADSVVQLKPKGYGTKPLPEDIFIQRVRAAQPNLCFSLTRYVRAKEKVRVICPIHGEFNIIASKIVKQGCFECSKDIRLSKGFDSFKEQSNKIHGKKYLYDKDSYKGANKKIRIYCSVHGWFEQYVNNHRKGHGCIPCTGKNYWNKESFFAKCREVHGGKFKYPRQNYNGVHEKIRVVCPVHGEFEATAGVHLKGCDCAKCAAQNNYGFAKSDFIDACKKPKRKAQLYVVKLLGDKEEFYKVGITSQSVEQRFKKEGMVYTYELLYLITGSADFIFDIEKRLHALLKPCKYIASHRFGGYTECFSKITKPVEKLLKEMSSTEQLQLLA